MIILENKIMKLTKLVHPRNVCPFKNFTSTVYDKAVYICIYVYTSVCMCVHRYLHLIFVIAGPPGDITDLTILSITSATCGIVMQWRRASSNPVCGPVWYTITITEGGSLVITNTTTMTSYAVTGLYDNTEYHFSVTASNIAGSGNSTSKSFMINNIGKSTHIVL